MANDEDYVSKREGQAASVAALVGCLVLVAAIVAAGLFWAVLR